MSVSKVYFAGVPEKSTLKDRKAAMQKVVNEYNFSQIVSDKDKVAVKTHFGERKNVTHIAPELIRIVADQVKKHQGIPFLTETATLYAGPRSHAISHIALAYDHGFTFEKVGIPIIMADGLMGNTEVEVSIPGILFKTVNIARDAVLADCLIAVSHPTGHMVSAIGACLKNLGMGLSSRKGKLQQHSSISPSIVSEKCTLCEVCMEWCPEDAIIEKNDAAFIIDDKCIGCGECLAVCKYNAVMYNFGIGSEQIQKSIAEYAFGAIIGKRDKCLFINVLADMTSECDCMNIAQTPIIPDVGILLSTDPVAIDQATLDLTKKANQKDLGKISWPQLDPNIQLEHGEKIGMGSRTYELIEL